MRTTSFAKVAAYAAYWLCLVVPLKSPSQINILVF